MGVELILQTAELLFGDLTGKQALENLTLKRKQMILGVLPPAENEILAAYRSPQGGLALLHPQMATPSQIHDRGRDVRQIGALVHQGAPHPPPRPPADLIPPRQNPRRVDFQKRGAARQAEGCGGLFDWEVAFVVD